MLTRLEAGGFRNLLAAEGQGDRLVVEFEPGSHLFLGENGAGKTSLMEAIYVLATTRSFRTARPAECRRHGESSFFLAGETDQRARLEVAWVDGERVRRLHGRRSSLAEHLAALPVVSWNQSDIEILVGGPQTRRRFLDRGVVGTRPTAISVISRYRKALEEKRKLLQSPSTGGLRDQLEPWNLVLAQACAELSRLRFHHVEALTDELRQVLDTCNLGFPEISLRYRPSPKEALDGEEAIFDRLQAVVDRELADRRPVLGCHRDELDIRWQGRPIRQVASAGERKALGLAITAAHGRVLEAVSVRPVYLLDDVDTELDAKRLASLWQFFGVAAQVMVTSNRPAVWRQLSLAARFQCRSGTISREA